MLLCSLQIAQAQVTLILNTPPQLPERVNDWERLNALFSVTVTNTGGTPLQRLRIAATVTNLDNNATLFRTKNDLTRPFTAPPRVPTTLTAPQILPANSFEYDASVQTALIRTNTLPEGAYRLCVRVIDERGATLGFEQCRTFNVIIPDPPSLISPANGDSVRRAAPSVPVLPQFQWTPVFARFGQQSKYKLRVVPVFEGQQPRQALEGNPVLLEKIVQTSSYQWLPSDAQFGNYPNAKGFAWQVQAVEGEITTAARAVGRNEGKSEIFTFGTPPPTSQVMSSDAPPMKGSKIKVGEFTMTLGDFTVNPNFTITGKGTIQIDWLKTAVNVQFDGITVEKKEVTKGEVLSVQTDGVPSFKDQLGSKMNLPSVPEGANLSFGTNSDNGKGIYEKAKAAISQIGKGAITLPLGYESATKTMFALSAMKFTKDDAQMNMLTRVPMPSLGADVALTLGAGEISFAPSGPKLSSFALFLAQDFAVPSSYKLTFLAPSQGTKGTLLKVKNWNVDEFAIGGKMEFPTTWFTKSSDGASTVTGTFSGSSKSLTAWIVSASIPDECNIAKLTDFKLKIDDLSLDMSDTDNPSGLVLPSGYGNGVQWRGFAIKKATITLPPYLKKFDSDSPLTLELSNFLIDGGGLTGTAQIAKKLDNINFGGFKGSIETFKVAFVTMSPTEVSLGGTLTLPVGNATIGVVGTYSGKQQGFSMAANLDANTTFQIGSAAEFMLYGKNGGNPAKAVTIAFDKDNGATASLSGQFTLTSGFGANVQGTEMSFKGIAFEGVKLSPQGAKVFTLGQWSYVNGAGQTKSFGTIGKDIPTHLSDEALADAVSDEVERLYAGGERLDLESAPMLAPEGSNGGEGFGGFPISIDTLYSSEVENKTIINVGLKLNLDGDGSSSGLSGTTTLAISFKANKGDKGKPMKFENADMDVKGIRVIGNIAGCVDLDGTIKFFSDDATYGNGFYGAITVTLLDAVKGDIATQFGRTEKLGRYWFVDANLLLKSGVAIGATGMSFYGFGGGVWKNMTVSGSGGFSGKTPQTMEIGESFSGLKFTPSSGNALGIKASCDIGLTGNSTTFNGSVALLGEFEDGSLSTLSLATKAFFMTEITKRPANPEKEAMAYADLTISMDFPASKFTCSGKYAINVTPSKKFLTANGSLDLLFSPEEWHIFLGTPQIPNKVTLFQVAESDSYFMLGENLPINAGFLASAAKATSKRNETQATDGSGIAFGMKQELKIPSDGSEARFLMFYAKLTAGWGFEMMITKTQAQCQGIGVPGINGWYVDGQIAAWMSGEAGVYIDTWFYEGKAKFIGVNAEANLRAKFPNPSWLSGTVTVGGEVLDGLLSLETSFPFELGEQCRNLTNSNDLLKDFEPIGEIQPSDGSKDVSTYAVPTVAFNQKMEFNPNNSSTQKTPSNFDIPLPEGGVARFRFITRSNDIVVEKRDANGAYSSVYIKKFSTSSDLKTASVLPEDELDSETDYRVTVTVKAEQFNFSSQNWKEVIFSDGKKGVFIKTLTFTTGKGVAAIPFKSIASMNPMLLQRFYLQNEDKTGRITFTQGLKSAFAGKGNYVVRIKNADTYVGEEITLNIVKNTEKAVKEISWKMPTLKNSTLYLMEICFQGSPTKLGDIKANTEAQSQSLKKNGYTVGSITSLKSTLAGKGGVITNAPNDKILGSYAFRTSKFNTFAEKIKTFRPQIGEGNAGNGVSLAKNLCPNGYFTSKVGNLRYFTRVGNWPPVSSSLQFPLSTYPYETPPESQFSQADWDSYISAAKDLGDLQQKASPGNTILNNIAGVLFSCRDAKSDPMDIYSLPYRLSMMKALSSMPAPHPLSFGTIANGIDFNVEEPFDDIEVKNVDIGFRIEVQSPISGSGIKKKWDNSSIIYLNPAQPVNPFGQQKEAPKTAKIRIQSSGLDQPWLGDYSVQCFRASYSEKADLPSVKYRTVIGETTSFVGITTSKLCKELDALLNEPTYWDFNEYEYTTPFYPLGKKEEPSNATLQTAWLFASK
ncbi:MAG: hypothetical protein MUF71_11700 [Candidatus Kapabacteria bacterium]|nr:hypothetical protein [Candidatus Kapabacteria bacterium]